MALFTRPIMRWLQVRFDFDSTDVRHTFDCLSKVIESRPPRCRMQPWAGCLHTCVSVTKQYNLVSDNGRWCS